jgi:hypothetical protein
MATAMRLRLFFSMIIAFLCVADPPAHAQPRPGTGCIGHFFNLVRNGITNLEAHTREGQPCQIGFGLRGSNIETLRIVMRPAHGVLGASEKEQNRRYVAYAPRAGFVGRDRFELLVRFMPPDGTGTYTSRLIVDMNVMP